MKSMSGPGEIFDRTDGAFAYRLFVDRNQPTLTVAEQIASGIGDRILVGDLLPGQRIIEQDIATEFQVSRGPVREALWILERENLVTLPPRRGAIVTDLTVDEVTELFEIRTGLHDVVARKMVFSQIPDFVKVMRVGVAKLQELAKLENDEGRYAETTYRLTLVGAQMSGNRRLLRMIASISLQTLRYSRLGLASRSRRAASVKLWKKSLDALESGDLETYVDLSRQRIEGSGKEAARNIKETQRTRA